MAFGLRLWIEYQNPTAFIRLRGRPFRHSLSTENDITVAQGSKMSNIRNLVFFVLDWKIYTGIYIFANWKWKEQKNAHICLHLAAFLFLISPANRSRWWGWRSVSDVSRQLPQGLPNPSDHRVPGSARFLSLLHQPLQLLADGRTSRRSVC